MAFSGVQVTRLGLCGGPRPPYGSFVGKAASPPSFSGTIPDISLTESGTGTNYALGAYFSGATSYSISPSVEAGWTFNTTTALLTVVPDTIGTYGPYTVTGTNSGGTADSNAFDVFVSAVAVSVDAPTAGWWNLYDLEMVRRERERKKRKKLEEEAEQLQDTIDKELVKALLAEKKNQDRVAELKRLSALAERHMSRVEATVSPAVMQAAEAAITRGNYSAMERFERELRRAKEEEEFLAMAVEMLMSQ